MNDFINLLLYVEDKDEENKKFVLRNFNNKKSLGKLKDKISFNLPLHFNCITKYGVFQKPVTELEIWICSIINESRYQKMYENLKKYDNEEFKF